MQDNRHALVERDPPRTLSFSAVLLGMLAMTAALLVMFWVSGCAPPASPAPPPGTVVLESSACQKACTHQRAIGCELGTPTPGGATCEEVCEDNAKNGFSWNTQCLAEAKSCDEACP